MASGQMDLEGKKITSVDIRSKGKKVDEAVIRDQITTRAGQTYSTERLDEDIKKLYASKIVDDVRWLAEETAEGVKLIVEVSARPVINAVAFVGSSKFDEDKLAKETKLKPGAAISDADILAARRNLEAYYQGYGYPDVSVDHRIEQNGDGAAVVFLVNEGIKNEVRNIRFEGNNNILKADLTKVMKVKEKGIFSFITKSGRIEGNQLDEDLEEILDYYRNKGFLRVSSTGIQRVPTGDGKIDLVIPINEGAKYKVAGVGFGKMTVYTPEELYKALTMVGGDAYSSKKMRADIEMIRSYYGARGYADAAVMPDIKNAADNSVQITYVINEGARFRVGRVNISGNTKSKDKVVRRESSLKPNDWFNSVDVEKTRTKLKNMNYFSDVQATTAPGGSGYRDLNILVSEKNTGNLSFGVGFSNIDNLVGYINLEQINCDIFNPWHFTGGGQRFAANIRAGQFRRDLSISLTEPWFLDRQLALGGELYYRNALFFSDFFDQLNVGASIFLRTPIDKFSFMRFEYRIENIELNAETGAQAKYFQDNVDGTYMRSALGASYTYDSRDAIQTPRSGHKFESGVTYSGLGGDVNTMVFNTRGEKYWNLPGDTILSFVGEIGVADSLNNDEVPIFDRQFLGGPRTLRGFEFRDVGPRDAASNEVIGGNTMAWASLEYSIPLFEQVRGAAFYDIGFVNQDSWDIAPSDFYSDAGLGLRLNLPIGPLAFDYAIPINAPDQEADKGGQFNFYLDYRF